MMTNEPSFSLGLRRCLDPAERGQETERGEETLCRSEAEPYPRHSFSAV